MPFFLVRILILNAYLKPGFLTFCILVVKFSFLLRISNHLLPINIIEVKLVEDHIAIEYKISVNEREELPYSYIKQTEAKLVFRFEAIFIALIMYLTYSVSFTQLKGQFFQTLFGELERKQLVQTEHV